MTYRLKGRNESFKITFSLNRPEMSQRRKFHFLLQILAAQAKIWHGEADVAFFEQSGGKNGNSYVRNLFDDALNSFFMSDRDTVAEVKELRTTFKKPVFSIR